MSGLYPTPSRLALVDGIAAGEVAGYPGWTRPQVFWRLGAVGEAKVTGRVFELLNAEPPLAAWAWAPSDGAALVPVRLTDAGRHWMARGGS